VRNEVAPPRLDSVSVVEYVAAQPTLRALVGTVDRVEVPGGGNINVVLRVVGSAGSVIVKQSLGYALVAEDWPMAPDRTRVEADLYSRWAFFDPGSVPAVYLYDAGSNVVALEDLSDHELWRTQLLEGRVDPSVAVRLGQTLAACAFHTSLLTLDAAAAASLATIADPGLEQVMEDVQFNQPWTDHPRNAVPEDLLADVVGLRGKPAFMSAVSRLHLDFRSRREVLTHGDLHTGSVMVRDGSVRMFDSEFARQGPAAWDLSQLWGNLLLAAVGSVARDRDRIEPIVRLIEAMWRAYETQLTLLWPERTTRLDEAFLPSWLRQTEQLAVGFAGVETGRRLVGLGKVPDIEEVPAEHLSDVRRLALSVGGEWATAREPTIAGLCEATIARLRAHRCLP
jgi:5-methylthioribose kinase